MKNTIRILGIISLILVIGFSMAACSDSDPKPVPDTTTPDTTTPGGTTGSSVTGSRYVYTESVSSSVTALLTLKFTGDTISASGAGVAYREDFTPSTMVLIPGHKYECVFTYTFSSGTVTITWPSEITSLSGDDRYANTPNGNAWGVAYHFGWLATNSTTFAGTVAFTQTGNDLVASYESRTWVYGL